MHSFKKSSVGYIVKFIKRLNFLTRLLLSDMKLMKGDEISLRHLGTSWEGKGHVVKVPDSILYCAFEHAAYQVFVYLTISVCYCRCKKILIYICIIRYRFRLFHIYHIYLPSCLGQRQHWQASVLWVNGLFTMITPLFVSLACRDTICCTFKLSVMQQTKYIG